MGDYGWETYLQRLSKRGQPADFKAFLAKHTVGPAGNPELTAAVYPMVIADDLGKAMLAASLELPAAEAERTLHQIAGVLPRLDYRRGLSKALSRQERIWHQSALTVVHGRVIPGSAALVATFQAYIRGDYDLEQDPNRLVQEASRLSQGQRLRRARARRRRQASASDPALVLVGQAGVLALRGQSLWIRWPEEASPPVNTWLMVLGGVIDHFEHYPEVFPLEAIENARLRWPEMFEALERKPVLSDEEVEDMESIIEHAGTLFDELEPFLYAWQTPTPEALARLPKPREDYIDLLWHNIRQWDEWDLKDPSVPPLLSNMIVLLGAFRADKAVDALIDVAAGTAGTDAVELAEESANALAVIGEPAREAVLDFLRYSENDPARAELAVAAPYVGRDDPRTFPVLAELFGEISWRDGKSEVAHALGMLGDKRAVPLLRAALRDPGADTFDRESIQDALEDLGAT